MDRFSLLTPVFVLVLSFTAGCDSITGLWQNGDGLDTRGATTMEVEGLAVHLFAPDTVAVADSFVVRAVVQNQGTEPRTVTTSCLLWPGIFDGGGSRVPFPGSRLLCGASVTTYKFPPGEVKERRFDMQAVLDTADGVEPVSSGSYTVRVTLDWTIEGNEVERSVERSLVVRQ